MFERMLDSFSVRVQKWLDVDEFDAKKIIYFSLGFLFVISASSVLRALKTSVFLGIVGKEHLPKTYLLSIIILVPCMFIYSKLVDKFRRHQLVYLMLLIYVVGGIIFAFLLAHPVIGLKNTQTSGYRFIGWWFEFFIDFYQALIIGTYWSFINSISTTKFATKSYGVIVATSRVGGILAPIFGLLVTRYSVFSSLQAVPFLIIVSSIFLIITALLIFKVKRSVPREHMHGYVKENKTSGVIVTKPKHSVLDGLKLLISEPYVLGIFGLGFCFEVISCVFDYQLQVLMSIEMNNNVMDMSSFMMIYTIMFQITSLAFAVFGTISLLKKFGLQICLMIGPVVAFASVAAFMILPSLTTILVIMIALRAMHYGFNMPLREMLYIPTVKDIQFKSKGWIDSFGRTFSKAFGSGFNEFSRYLPNSLGLFLSSAFSLFVILTWVITAFLMGKKYMQTVEDKKIIGAVDQDSDSTVK